MKLHLIKFNKPQTEKFQFTIMKLDLLIEITDWEYYYIFQFLKTLKHNKLMVVFH